jgi:hypothetical protein
MNRAGRAPSVGQTLAPETDFELVFRASVEALCAALSSARVAIPETPNAMRLAVLLYPEAYKRLQRREVMPAASP